MAPSKIIVVGAAWYNDWARLYAHAFRRMGFATDIVFNNSMPAPLGGEQESVTALFERAKARVRKASPRFFATLKHWRVRLSERELLGRVRACRNLESVLVIFVWTPGSEATLQKLREIKNVRLVLWLGEPSIRDAHWAGTFKYFDHLFIVDDGLWMDTLPSAFQGKFKLLPLSSDETTFKPVKIEVPDKLRSEISFIGKYIPRRAEALSIFQDRDIKIYGYGWEAGFEAFPWLRDKYCGSVTNEEANLVYNNSKIVIGTLGAPKDPFTTATQRTFDIALAGAFQVSEYVAFAEKLFGDSVKMYHNDEELGTLVHYYLAHEEERQTLAHKAHEIAVTGHSYAVRAAQVLSEAGYDA